MAICVSPIWCKEYKVSVPCGRCMECLKNRRNDWSFRLEKQMKSARSAYFVTLTYSDEHLPEKLVKEHLQGYIKRLRIKNKYVIKYYATGEYGEKFGRPHYHLIIFNVDDQERLLDEWRVRDGNNELVNAGFVQIGNVTSARINYVTKYVIHNAVQKGFTQDTRLENIPPSLKDGGELFCLISKNLGINYMYDNFMYHKLNRRNYVEIDGKKQRLPRYYSDKIFTYQEKEKIYVENFERISDNELKMMDKFVTAREYFEDRLMNREQKYRKFRNINKKDKL